MRAKKLTEFGVRNRMLCLLCFMFGYYMMMCFLCVCVWGGCDDNQALPRRRLVRRRLVSGERGTRLSNNFTSRAGTHCTITNGDSFSASFSSVFKA